MKLIKFSRIGLAACLLWSCAEAPVSHHENRPLSGLPIVYSANVSGEIEPCGCRGNPSGGLDRRWNAQKEVFASFDEKQPLVVDSGDLFFRGAPVPFLLAPQWKYQAQVLVEGYNSLGIEFLAPGELDFAAGMDAFIELRHRARFKVLSSNIYEELSGALVFDASAVVEKNGKKIGILGVYDEELDLPAGYRARPHIEAVKQEVNKLRSEKNVAVVVALTHLGLEKDRLLAASVSGIDVIVGAHSHSFLTKPERVGETIILHSSYRGQHLGVFLDGTNTFYQLEDRYISPAGRSNPMDQLLLRSKKRIAELNAESDAEIFGDAVPAKNKHVRAEKKVRNTTTPGQVLQTFAQCAQCHSKQHEFVSKTRHSSAYLTLMKVGQNRNLECLQCHTLGQGMPSGYSHVDRLVIGTDGSQLNVEKFASELPQMSVAELRKVKRALINVQCESCHSVAPTHARKSGGTNISPKPGAATCLACHTSDRAPGWYRDGKLDQKLFAEKLESVSCPR